MGKHLDNIAFVGKRCRNYAELLAKGITPDIAGRKPRAGDKEIDCNHPAFVFGHLARYPSRVLILLGLDGSSIATPAPWEDLFKAGAPCVDDPGARHYPSWDAVRGHFLHATDHVLSVLPGVDDARLLEPVADPKVREYFPIVGMGVDFLLGAHVMVHLGQVSTWRRCFGLPAVM